MRTKSDALGTARGEKRAEAARESIESAKREGVLNARKRRREDDYQSRCRCGEGRMEEGIQYA